MSESPSTSWQMAHVTADPFWTTLLVVIPVTTLYWFYSSQKRTKQEQEDAIPWAPGAVPVLGHALAYRKSPSQFLLQTSQQVGPVFQLNMAGKHMIIVCGEEQQRAVAMAPESVLSARKAVADIGFEESLGHANVHLGTDLHKGIVKGIWNSDRTVELQAWMDSIQTALIQEIPATDKPSTMDFFPLVRRVMLRSVIDRMISPDFLSGWNSYDFLADFQSFQDQLEDVTAKATVLPRWLALPALLWPLKRRRLALQRKIAKHLSGILSKRLGFWLEELVRQEIPVELISEYIVGLLFAAHKNAAIGAAQAYLLLWERGSRDDQQICQTEAQRLLLTTDWSTLQSCSRLRRLCLESLRITAHSIGGVRTAQQDFALPVTRKTKNGATLKRPVIVPQGATIGLSHIAPSLSSEHWGDKADTFDLNLHSDELYQDEYRFTTFSHGVHMCPGQRIALVLLQCANAVLLQNYQVTLPSHIPPLSFERATLAQREGRVLVKIQPKADSQ